MARLRKAELFPLAVLNSTSFKLVVISSPSRSVVMMLVFTSWSIYTCHQ